MIFCAFTSPMPGSAFNSSLLAELMSSFAPDASDAPPISELAEFLAWDFFDAESCAADLESEDAWPATRAEAMVAVRARAKSSVRSLRIEYVLLCDLNAGGRAARLHA